MRRSETAPAWVSERRRADVGGPQKPTGQSKITGAQLNAARQSLGWTLRELAARCGISLGSITRLTMAGEWPLRARPETIAAIERVSNRQGWCSPPARRTLCSLRRE